MHCPKCGMDLVEIDYNDIKVDKCTGCEGIWLDAGELETVLDQGETESGGVSRFLGVFRRSG